MSLTLASATASISATASNATTSASSSSSVPASYKVIGISLAVGSGLLIGASFVVKKKGLLRATSKSGGIAGEGHAYLRDWLWWTGMTMMILGEVCNFAAFAFTAAILVTPLGALSVVVCAILSKFFLGETLTFFGIIGCALCILGSVILALNAPETQAVHTIPAFQKLWVSPGFLVWAGLCIAASLVLAFYVAPRWGKKNMFVYIGICSLIGGLSVSTLQGVGASILTSIRGENQFKHWFLYVVSGFTVVTLLIEINYLNKALELFNTSMVTPTYYIIFTTCTLVSSFILYGGLKTSAVSLISMIMGFLVTCLGITLLQMSKVDPKNFEKLDRRSTMLMAASRSQTEDAEKQSILALEQPGMDALRGGFGTVGSIIRARSARRLSNASTLPGRPIPYRGPSSAGFSTPRNNSVNMAEMQRYSLTDTPMEGANDTFDEVSFHSGHSAHHQQRKNTLKFDDTDVVHKYDRKGKVEPIHMSQAHGYLQSERQDSGLVSPGLTARGFSTNSIQTIPEVSEADRSRGSSIGRDLAAAAEKPSKGLPTLNYGYPVREEGGTDPLDPLGPPVGMTTGNSRSSFTTILHRFTHSEAPDLSLRMEVPKVAKMRSEDNMKRGGVHRGTKDYPHLGKEEKAVEVQERQALVASSKEEEEALNLSDESMVASPVEEKDLGAMDRESLPQSRSQSGTSTPRRLPNLPTSSTMNTTTYPPS